MGYIRDNDDFDAANPNYEFELQAELAKLRAEVKTLQARLAGATCETCRFWSKEPIPQNVGGKPSTEKWCLLSRNVVFGAYGQDGKAIITHGCFGCGQHEPKPHE